MTTEALESVGTKLPEELESPKENESNSEPKLILLSSINVIS